MVELATDRPEERFRPGSIIHTEEGSTLTVEGYEATDRSPLLTFQQVDGRERAEELRNTLLYIPADQRRPLEENEFWPDELVGLDVFHADGSRLGTVVDLESGVGQDRLVVETDAGAVTVPFVAELVPEIDAQDGRITVSLPPGFLD